MDYIKTRFVNTIFLLLRRKCSKTGRSSSIVQIFISFLRSVPISAFISIPCLSLVCPLFFDVQPQQICVFFFTQILKRGFLIEFYIKRRCANDLIFYQQCIRRQIIKQKLSLCRKFRLNVTDQYFFLCILIVLLHNKGSRPYQAFS